MANDQRRSLLVISANGPATTTSSDPTAAEKDGQKAKPACGSRACCIVRIHPELPAPPNSHSLPQLTQSAWFPGYGQSGRPKAQMLTDGRAQDCIYSERSTLDVPMLGLDHLTHINSIGPLRPSQQELPHTVPWSIHSPLPLMTIFPQVHAANTNRHPCLTELTKKAAFSIPGKGCKPAEMLGWYHTVCGNMGLGRMTAEPVIARLLQLPRATVLGGSEGLYLDGSI
ncbi:hypothetical protein P691DRAFT_782450 [Macrolepiota fuliginosa MF-IS2]|uniref:Uncharacterized protein n=1 Tax=Macrolepiota fuliginosa MF-IS2 TaxID=1400762 RepID=A0A9P5XCA8_9AGAR|nr:hypothetical protein P691DRAFT_782450 [Macrolepiota fuliginosa MF-IS2]